VRRGYTASGEQLSNCAVPKRIALLDLVGEMAGEHPQRTADPHVGHQNFERT
jgi:hypothetical protein